MLITPVNADNAILQNIKQTLEQIKLSTDLNQPLVVDHAVKDSEDFETLSTVEFDALTTGQFDELPIEDISLTVMFYADKEKNTLVFSDDSLTNPDRFILKGTKTLYTPPDSLMNTGTNLDSTCFLPLYYVTATFSDGITRNLTYRNVDNLLFQKVMVSTKKDPEFGTNDNVCVLVPGLQQLKNVKQSESRGYMIMPFDLYLQMDFMERKNLTEEALVIRANALANAIRLALYQDRYRNGYAVLFNEDIDGTYVGQATVQPSKAYLRAKLCVKVARMVAPNTY